MKELLVQQLDDDDDDDDDDSPLEDHFKSHKVFSALPSGRAAYFSRFAELCFTFFPLLWQFCMAVLHVSSWRMFDLMHLSSVTSSEAGGYQGQVRRQRWMLNMTKS